MGAAADCEAIGNGLLGQPVNSLTTLALAIAGVVVLTLRTERRWVGVALIATGVGSFLFHGPMPPGNEWAHDVTLAWLLAVIAGSGTNWEKYARLPALAAVGLLFALAPAVADPIAVGLAVLAVLSLLRHDRSPATVGPLVLVGVAAVLGRMGATGGPLCDPGSPFQMHGFWHIAAALGVVWWALGGPAAIESPTSQDRSRG